VIAGNIAPENAHDLVLRPARSKTAVELRHSITYSLDRLRVNEGCESLQREPPVRFHRCTSTYHRAGA
jgi:hypothetical protein